MSDLVSNRRVLCQGVGYVGERTCRQHTAKAIHSHKGCIKGADVQVSGPCAWSPTLPQAAIWHAGGLLHTGTLLPMHAPGATVVTGPFCVSGSCNASCPGCCGTSTPPYRLSKSCCWPVICDAFVPTQLDLAQCFGWLNLVLPLHAPVARIVTGSFCCSSSCSNASCPGCCGTTVLRNCSIYKPGGFKAGSTSLANGSALYIRGKGFSVRRVETASGMCVMLRKCINFRVVLTATSLMESAGMQNSIQHVHTWLVQGWVWGAAGVSLCVTVGT